jgi:DNA-directed RNA polymerase subunit RPC12/RpoP
MTGKCQKCGANFHGWALDDPVKRVCEKCGGTVEIMEDTPGERLFDGTEIPPALEINRPLKLRERIERII